MLKRVMFCDSVPEISGTNQRWYFPISDFSKTTTLQRLVSGLLSFECVCVLAQKLVVLFVHFIFGGADHVEKSARSTWVHLD